MEILLLLLSYKGTVEAEFGFENRSAALVVVTEVTTEEEEMIDDPF
jgi:hypothetical protein